jgi:Tol biopolymer transport system component
MSMLYTTAEGELVLHDARRNTSRTLATGVSTEEAQAVSPSGRYLAFNYATADSSHLALLDLTTQSLQRVHAVSGVATYSLDWHPDQDRLAFGYYRPIENGTRGPGSIRVATPDGTTRSVGCSAAREVLHWLSDGALATRTDDNLYVVAAKGCATQASLDARRMHLIHYAPDGRQMAYIHRELRYDRDAGEYVPDSSLVLSGPRGENTETLFGDKRHVRHLRWSPDGSELAFDVAVQESGHRQLVVYDGSRPTFLIPPNQTTADQVHPRWSPSGTRLAFTLRTGEEAYAAVRVKGQTRRLGRTRGPVWGWLDERSVVVPGPDSVRVKTLNGTTRLTHPTPATILYVWSRPVS